MMALPNILKSLFPNVPNSPGVPTLLRSTSKIISGVVGAIGVFNSLQRLFGSDKTEWGVFDQNNNLVAQATSVIGVYYRNGSRVSDYPVEQGAFASYNKVADPYSVRVRMVSDGSTSLGFASLLNPLDALTHKDNRKRFVDALDNAANSLNLYTVVTPEKTFVNANIESWEFPREVSNGAHIIIADINLREVRQIAATGSSTKTASGANTNSQGQVQASTPTNPVVTSAKIN